MHLACVDPNAQLSHDERPQWPPAPARPTESGALPPASAPLQHDLQERLQEPLAPGPPPVPPASAPAQHDHDGNDAPERAVQAIRQWLETQENAKARPEWLAQLAAAVDWSTNFKATCGRLGQFVKKHSL